MLLVSGADLVGKSTFCKFALKALNDLGYAHTPHRLGRLPKAFDSWHHYVEMMCHCAVWDRFHLDELAYRQRDDYPTQITPLKFDLVEAQARSFGAFQVVMLATEEQIRERHATRGDDMYDLDHILRVNETFEEMALGDVVTDMRGLKYHARVDAVLRDQSQWATCVERYVDHAEEYAELCRS